MSVPSGVILPWPGTAGSIPSGWSRVASLDGRYLKGAPAGQEPDVTGGAATHTHTSPTHTHSIPSHGHAGNGATGTGQGQWYDDEGGYSVSQTFHTHTVGDSSTSAGTSDATAATWGTTSNDPPYVTTVFVASDGSPEGVPDGMWAWWDVDPLPSGWVQPASAQDRFLKGAPAAGDGGDTGGAASHVHTGVAHTHGSGHTHTASTGNASAMTSAFGSRWAATNHTHSLTFSGGTIGNASSANTGTTEHEPPWKKLAVVENDSGVPDLPVGITAAYLGNIASAPPGWKVCDGTGGTLDLHDRFLKGADALSEIGDTGGAVGHDHTNPAGHTHSGAHAHTGLTGAPSSYQNFAGTNGAQYGAYTPTNTETHTHGSTSSTSGSTTGSGVQTVDANVDTQPPFRTLLFIKFVEALDVTIDSPEEDEALGAPLQLVEWSFSGSTSGVQNDYRLEVSESPLFSPLVYDSGTVGSAVEQHEIPSGYLRNNRTYYLRVTIHDADNLYGRSATRHVATAWTPPSPVLGLAVDTVGGW